jgi:hypothetical protein
MSVSSKFGFCYQTKRIQPELKPSSASPLHPRSPTILRYLANDPIALHYSNHGNYWLNIHFL